MRAVAILALSLLAGCGGEPTGPDMNVTGEPCAMLTALPTDRSARQSSTAAGATIRRQGGQASCQGQVEGDGSAGANARCDLSGAGLIHVTTAGGREHYFDVPTVQRSTLLIEGDSVRCVLTREQ